MYLYSGRIGFYFILFVLKNHAWGEKNTRCCVPWVVLSSLFCFRKVARKFEPCKCKLELMISITDKFKYLNFNKSNIFSILMDFWAFYIPFIYTKYIVQYIICNKNHGFSSVILFRFMFQNSNRVFCITSIEFEF